VNALGVDYDELGLGYHGAVSEIGLGCNWAMSEL